MDSPLVSVIIPVYNGAHFLDEAIQSVITQTYKTWELIIVDDGSTDESFNIAKNYSDKNIHVIKQRNRGGCAARNKALEIAKGEFIKFLDADDVLKPNTIKRQIDKSSELENNEIVFGDFDFIDENSNVFSEVTFNKESELVNDQIRFFLTNWVILMSSPLHKMSLINKISGFDERLLYGHETYLHYRLALEGVKFVYDSLLTFSYRTHQTPSRNSIQRRSKPSGWEQIYRLEMEYKLIKLKDPIQSERYHEIFSQKHFQNAFIYYQNGQKALGKYHLCMARNFSKYGIPKFRGKRVWGLFYLILGNLIGFSNYKYIQRILDRKTKKTLYSNVFNANSGVATKNN